MRPTPIQVQKNGCCNTYAQHGTAQALIAHLSRLDLNCSRLEPGPLIVDRHVLPLHPHRVLAPEVDALSAIQPLPYGQILEFHAHPAPAPARRVVITVTCTAIACVRSGRAAVVVITLVLVVLVVEVVMALPDDDKVLAVPADIVDAGRAEGDVARAREPLFRLELELLPVSA